MNDQQPKPVSFYMPSDINVGVEPPPIQDLLRAIPPEPPQAVPADLPETSQLTEPPAPGSDLNQEWMILKEAFFRFTAAIENVPAATTPEIPDPRRVTIQLIADVIDIGRTGDTMTAELDDELDAMVQVKDFGIRLIDKSQFTVIERSVPGWAGMPVESLTVTNGTIKKLKDAGHDTLGPLVEGYQKDGVDFFKKIRGIKTTADQIVTALKAIVPGLE